MATLSSLGVGAGFDTESIVTKLVALEKAPAEKILSENNKLNTRLSTWGRVQGAFSALRDASAALNRDSFWQATTATSSDTASVAVTTSAGAPAGAYSVNVTSLASSQFVSSAAFKSGVPGSEWSGGDGNLRITLGTYESEPGPPPAITFAAKAAALAVDIPIGPGDNTLEKIRDRINAANAGVTASLVSDAAGTRLVMRGPSGESNAFKVEVTEGATPGLSALAYDRTTGAPSSMTLNQPAGNAQATINGIAVSSESNTLTNVLDGLTLQLNKVTTNPVDVSVSQDTASMRTGIENFQKAYNDLVGLIRVQTLYDEASKTAGPLQGDSTATGLLRQIRSLVGSSSTASGTFSRLASVGFDIKTDGTLSLDGAKLNKAMENLPELKKLFANDDSNPAAQGMSRRFQNLASQIVGSDGIISTRQEGLKASIKRNGEKIERLEDRVALIEARLRKQYTTLDTNMGNLTALQNYVTQQLSALTNKSS